MPTDSSSSRRLFASLFTVFFFFNISIAKGFLSNFYPTDSTLNITTDTLSISAPVFAASLRNDMVTYAQEFLGIHYRYAGRSPETGFDCSGFTHFVMRHFDVDISTCSRAQIGEGRKVDLKSVKPGDLIFFRRSSKSRISHVAMVVANDGEEGLYIIHSTSRGVVVDNLLTSKYWRPKVYAARDVLYQFSDRYATKQLQLYLAQRKLLQEMNIDLDLLAKSIRI